MSQMEYSDRQDFEREVKDYGKQIETLGESQKDYQEDMESLQKRLKMLKSQPGVYANSDNKLIGTVALADEILPHIQPKYRVAVEKRVHLETLDFSLVHAGGLRLCSSDL
jgi:chromosome segregation ATPase